MLRFPLWLRSFSTVSIPLVKPPTATTPIISNLPQNEPPRKRGLPLNAALNRINSQRPNLYAKLLIHNFPFTVVRTDFVVTHRMRNVQVGDVITLDQICEVGSTDYKLRGLPLLPKGAVKVVATVMEHSHGEKKRARMRKQRKGRRPLRTIKPRMTTLRVQDIIIDPDITSNDSE